MLAPVQLGRDFVTGANVLRRLRPFAVLAVLPFVGPPQPSTMRDTYPERIAIASRPITLDDSVPSRTRVGALTLLAGWRLTSPSPQFGGFSTLTVEGDRITTISDAGSVLRFRLTRFGHATAARIDPLPRGCGRTDDKRYRDTESAVREPVSGDWLIGFEWRNALCRISPDFTAMRGVVAPPAMANWRRSSGPEAMLALADGRIVVLAEADPRPGSDTRPLLLFDRDPVLAGATVRRFAFRPPPGFDPTDMTALPDGRWLIVTRRFSPNGLFTVKLVLADPHVLTAGVLDGTVLAHFAAPVLHDNFEGVSVTVEDGRPVVWLISDDNFFAWQGTYLLKLAIDPAALRLPQPPRSTPTRSAP